MRAFLKNYRQAPRKVRLVAAVIRGKKVVEARLELAHMPQKAAAMFKKLIDSAVANAKQADPSVDEGTLRIGTVTADKGITYVRHMPRAFGRATPINRECSHVRLTLVAPAAKTPTKKPVASTSAASAPKVAAPKRKTAKKEQAKQ